MAVLDQKEMFFAPLSDVVFLLIRGGWNHAFLFFKCGTINSACFNKNKRSQHELQHFLLKVVVPFPIVMILTDDPN